MQQTVAGEGAPDAKSQGLGRRGMAKVPDAGVSPESQQKGLAAHGHRADELGGDLHLVDG